MMTRRVTVHVRRRNHFMESVGTLEMRPTDTLYVRDSASNHAR